eukprot:Skav219184  [mRNA]  locus=scaffold648:590067:591410:- [translate_table: standard]
MDGVMDRFVAQFLLQVSTPTSPLMACLRLATLLLCSWHVLARTNKPSVQQNIKNQWGYVIWGDHIDHQDYLDGIIAVVSDFVCTGACGFTYAYFDQLVQNQIAAFTSDAQWRQVGEDFIKQLARNPDTIRSIVAGNAFIKGTIGVASYNHWTDECRFCCPCPLCTCRFNCNDCGTYRISRPNTHQPYFAFTVRAKTKEYKFSLTNNCHKEVQLALRYLPTGGSWTSKCWYIIRPGATITPTSGGQALRSTNTVWYFYAETVGHPYTWQGTDNTRACRGRSLGMRKMTSVSGSRLTLGLTCSNLRRLSENETKMDEMDEMPDQQLCLMAEDGLEGVELDNDTMEVLRFPTHFEDEGVGVPPCTEIHDSLGVGFSHSPAFAFNSKAVPPVPSWTNGTNDQANETNGHGEVDEVTQDPSCDKTCVAIEESYQELQRKLSEMGRRLGENLV